MSRVCPTLVHVPWDGKKREHRHGFAVVHEVSLANIQRRQVTVCTQDTISVILCGGPSHFHSSPRRASRKTVVSRAKQAM